MHCSYWCVVGVDAIGFISSYSPDRFQEISFPSKTSMDASKELRMYLSTDLKILDSAAVISYE